MNKNVQDFVAFVRSECKAHGIKFRLKPTKTVLTPEKIRCVGYCEPDDLKELIVAKKDLNWLMTLVHEYAHLTQWIDQCKEWKDTYGIDNVDDWLNGKDVPNIKRALAITRDMELDNEKRSVKLIKQWNLPIDTKIYTQKANAYVQYYNYLYFTRRWMHPDNSPARNPKVYKKMPSTFRMNYEVMEEKYKKIFQAAGI
jgi:hypothetical protein